MVKSCRDKALPYPYIFGQRHFEQRNFGQGSALSLRNWYAI